eukprot:symbB.v1.2.030523.t1/scaffold3438.1/size56642/3
MWLFERNLWLRKDSGCSRAIVLDDKLVCCFMFLPPDTPDISFWQMLKAGILKLPLIFGPSALRRLLQAKDLEEAELNIDGAYKLERMVVHPSVQGNGIGTRALQLALKESDAARRPVLLTTNEARNVTFYKRLGFNVVREAARELGGDTYSVWVMERPPARPRIRVAVAGASCGWIALHFGTRRKALERCFIQRSGANRPVIYELFSGVGGMRLAYQAATAAESEACAARFRAYDIDEVCCHVYGDLYGASKVLSARKEEPWNKMEPTQDELWRCSIDKLPEAAFEGADLWLASPPCQPFTRTGKRKDVADPRCRALLRLIEVLPQLKAPPKGLLLENVVGFQSSVAHDRLRSALDDAGYDVIETLLNPIDFAMPIRATNCAATASVSFFGGGGKPAKTSCTARARRGFAKGLG